MMPSDVMPCAMRRYAICVNAIYAIAALALAGCLRPSEDFVDLDRQVGQQAIAAAQIAIEDGRAAVQRFEPGALDLWASAPAFDGTLTVEPDAPSTWTVTLRNVMADAILTVDGAPVEAMARPFPTEAVYQLELAPGARSLTLAEPPGGDAFRFVVLSDIQDAIDEAGDIIDLIEQQPDVRFLIAAGDLTEQGYADEYATYVATFRRMSIPYYATPGNHERGASPENWSRYFGRANHSWPYRRARFTFVDSSHGTVDPTVYDWLDDWLAAGRDAAHVLVTHVPIMDAEGVRGGQFRSRNEAAKLLVKMARGDVDLALFGHVHSYYNYSLAGVPTIISGGGGALPERLDGIDRHFLLIDVEGDAIARTQVVRVD